MNNEEENETEAETEAEGVLDRGNITTLTQSAVLIGMAVVLPLFHQQAITGPLVNAVLFVTTALLGIQTGIVVGLIPSVIALSVGTLPAPLAPMVPYIMIGNAIMIVTFALLKNKNYWVAMIVASVLKFAFLFASSSLVIGLLMKKELAASVAVMMSWPQLITALMGGMIAWVVLKSVSTFSQKSAMDKADQSSENPFLSAD